MPFCVLLKSLDVPEVDKLTLAFDDVPHLTKYDAKFQVRNACGIVGQHLSQEQARSLSTALARQEVPSIIVDHADLFELPPPRKLKRAACTRRCFEPKNALEQTQPVAWPHVLVLCAGMVPVEDVERHSRLEPVSGAESDCGFRQVTDVTTKHGDVCRLEIVLEVEPFRYQVKARDFLYESRDVTQGGDRRDHFRQLIRDMVAHAPDAVRNRGVVAITEDETKFVAYRSGAIFEREIVWLLWRHSHPMN
jgi:hypothetical protein